MTEFRIDYHNIDLKFIQKKINNNKKQNEEIKNILINLTPLNISKEKTDLNDIKNVANQLILKNDTFVVFGTGGSNLGAMALVNMLQVKSSKKIIFFDNIDPIDFNNSILKLNLNKTCFIIISKSGSTLETLSQFSCIIEIFKSKNITYKLSNSCIIITEDKDSPLKRIGNELDCKILNHDLNIGGRYSVFSNVGLLPAYIAGLNINKIREGALSIISKIKNDFYIENYLGAGVITYLQSNKSINLNVLMTYSNSLYFFGKWYLQLWAESLGKDKKGITPLHFVGTTDQHSQLQLYLDGPQDKFFTLITTDYRKKGLKMNKEIFKTKDTNFLVNKTMGDLMYAEQQATLSTFIKKGFPVRQLHIDKINEYTLGQLMAYYMVETIITCYLIGVNPFNQPAVEYSKRLAKAYLLKNN